MRRHKAHRRLSNAEPQKPGGSAHRGFHKAIDAYTIRPENPRNINLKRKTDDERKDIAEEHVKACDT